MKWYDWIGEHAVEAIVGLMILLICLFIFGEQNIFLIVTGAFIQMMVLAPLFVWHDKVIEKKWRNKNVNTK